MLTVTFIGMYSRTAWGGPVEPFILAKFFNSTIPEGTDPIVSLIIFQWEDKDLIGIADSSGGGRVSHSPVPFVGSK